jgi:hypothetical protein
VPVTGTGRVWGVSISSAPSVTTVVTPRASTWPSSSATNLRHLMFGSMPCTRITSAEEPGGLHTDSRVVGQSTLRVTPSTMRTVGRVTWKS